MASLITEKRQKMKRLFLALSLIAMAFLSRSCYYDSEEMLYPELGGGCDTTAVTFTSTIKPILANNCYSCHSNATAASYGGNIRLEDYSDVASSSAAVSGSINHSGGYSPMPKNGGMLNKCLLLQYEKWIILGMPDN